MSLDFLAPGRLWLLVAVAALALLYAGLQLRQKRYVVRFTNLELLDSVAPRRPGWRRHATAAVFLLALVAMVVAYAQPLGTERVPRERATVMLALDTSLSMEATDVEPTRWEAAKVAAREFLERVPDTINVGLVTFDGSAVVRVAPTTEHGDIRRALEDVELQESTAIGEAVFASLQALSSVPPDEEGTPPPARIILMSDGETTIGRPTEAAIPAAVEADVPVSTIAFGTAEGVVTIDPDGSGIEVPVNVPVDEGALRALAEGTGGTFFDADSADELDRVFADLGSSVGFEEEEVEVTHRAVGVALALLAVSAAMSLVWFARLP